MNTAQVIRNRSKDCKLFKLLEIDQRTDENYTSC